MEKSKKASLEGLVASKSKEEGSLDPTQTLDWKSQPPMELKLRAITRPRMKKLKASNGNKDNGMDRSWKQLKRENWLSVGEGHPTADGSPTPIVASSFSSQKGLKRSRPTTDGISRYCRWWGALGQC
ncbi:hypothetical protein M9H77_30287 [Catharanthus roseus]|uniref:Uncharacterized protein n=1 Tax=Catharanthus roseus TaxID=4058 RepID=A0ACB9ZXV1_CATRO|nr:hypothetical protein M9H77_30287 [Catharanthus roseus]